MASIKYLWQNRARFNLMSGQFYKAWAKRILSMADLLKRNWKRNQLIRYGAKIHELAEIGEVVVSGNRSLLKIGKFSFIGKVNIALHEEVLIGDHVCINDGVEILTASHNVNDPKWQTIMKRIVIEDYVWIGTGAMILPGVTIGKGAVVGARAVVTKSVLPFEIVVGNPAKPISKTRSMHLDYNPCEFIAANRSWLIG